MLRRSFSLGSSCIPFSKRFSSTVSNVRGPYVFLDLLSCPWLQQPSDDEVEAMKTNVKRALSAAGYYGEPVFKAFGSDCFSAKCGITTTTITPKGSQFAVDTSIAFALHNTLRSLGGLGDKKDDISKVTFVVASSRLNLWDFLKTFKEKYKKHDICVAASPSSPDENDGGIATEEEIRGLVSPGSGVSSVWMWEDLLLGKPPLN